MSDTPPAVMERYRAMLLARSPGERLKMGCSMGATARALVRASVLAHDPHASPTDLRWAIFLRLYGHEFDAVVRERILVWLSLDESPPAASWRRVPVNWDDLEMALTMNRGEWACYLDLRTGEVHRRHVDDEVDQGAGLADDALDAGLAAGQLVRVDPLGSSAEYGWMVAFTETVSRRRLRERLELALHGRGAFRRFKEALRDAPAERERWLAFRDERLRRAARDWLADEGLEPTTTPPRRAR